MDDFSRVYPHLWTHPICHVFFCSAYDFLASPPKKTETWLLGGCSYHLGRRCSKEPWSTYSRRGVQKKKIRLWADASGATSRWWVSFRGPAAKWPLFHSENIGKLIIYQWNPGCAVCPIFRPAIVRWVAKMTQISGGCKLAYSGSRP